MKRIESDRFRSLAEGFAALPRNSVERATRRLAIERLCEWGDKKRISLFECSRDEWVEYAKTVAPGEFATIRQLYGFLLKNGAVTKSQWKAVTFRSALTCVVVTPKLKPTPAPCNPAPKQPIPVTVPLEIRLELVSQDGGPVVGRVIRRG